MHPIRKTNSVIAGRYKIIKKIGSGGMSVVYEVFDNRLDKSWAMKEMCIARFPSKDQKDMIKKFEREAKILAKLKHPCIPFVADHFTEGQSYFIVMDLIYGEDLQSILERHPRGRIIDIDQVINWTIQVAEIINYLHCQKPPIVYRDIKPSNIILTDSGRIVLTDFGIAGWLRGATQQLTSNLSQHQTIPMGSPGFSPPEQYSGKTDIRSDIYSLGATMHYLLTGIDPQKNPFQFEPLRSIRPDASSELEQFILRATQSTPSLRFQTIEEVIFFLEEPTTSISKIVNSVRTAFQDGMI